MSMTRVTYEDSALVYRDIAPEEFYARTPAPQEFCGMKVVIRNDWPADAWGIVPASAAIDISQALSALMLQAHTPPPAAA